MGLSIDSEKVIKGLEFTKAMITLNPSTGEDIEPGNLNEADKTTYDACVGAIALLKEQEEEIENLKQTAQSMMEGVCLLKDQEADKWIPVTERLPEVRNAVLCYSPHHKNIWALSLHEDGEWYYWIPMYQKYNPDFEGPITHWMPLPEHPKEGR